MNFYSFCTDILEYRLYLLYTTRENTWFWKIECSYVWQLNSLNGTTKHSLPGYRRLTGWKTLGSRDSLYVNSGPPNLVGQSRKEIRDSVYKMPRFIVGANIEVSLWISWILLIFSVRN